MTPSTATPEDLKSALQDLILCASGFARGAGREQARGNLLQSIKLANQVLHAELSLQPSKSPDEMINSFIDNGGKWHELVAAVNRASLKGATR
ncbi:hypothetical protein [Kiloniella litopenaei]|uniref:hypothetical protein n=1 Tax=Kiloniella litopenaei TaxID=1549748 RepID=UPI003BABF1E4